MPINQASSKHTGWALALNRTYSNRTHTRQVCNCCRTTQNKHWTNDDVSRKANECVNSSLWIEIWRRLPKEHEYKVCELSPSRVDDFKKGMSIRCVKFEFCCQLWVTKVKWDYYKISRNFTMAKSKIWTVAPEPYHQGPLIPGQRGNRFNKWVEPYATLTTYQIYMLQHYFATRISTVSPNLIWIKLELTKVAAHVHADTIPEAISPGFTLREALENSSELLGEKAV